MTSPEDHEPSASQLLEVMIKEEDKELITLTPEELEAREKEEKRRKYEMLKEFKCETCGKHFHRSADLRRHSICHTGVRPYVCAICHKAFAQKPHLATHSLLHMERKPFPCHLCEKGYTQRQKLDSHIKIVHEQSRPYTCTTCDKTFARPDTYKLHIKRHDGYRPFACHFCQRTFTQAYNFKNHMALHTNTNPNICVLCNSSFSDRGSLNRHRRKVHKLQNIPNKSELEMARLRAMVENQTRSVENPSPSVESPTLSVENTTPSLENTTSSVENHTGTLGNATLDAAKPTLIGVGSNLIPSGENSTPSEGHLTTSVGIPTTSVSKSTASTRNTVTSVGISKPEGKFVQRGCKRNALGVGENAFDGISLQRTGNSEKNEEPKVLVSSAEKAGNSEMNNEKLKVLVSSVEKTDAGEVSNKTDDGCEVSKGNTRKINKLVSRMINPSNVGISEDVVGKREISKTNVCEGRTKSIDEINIGKINRCEGSTRSSDLCAAIMSRTMALCEASLAKAKQETSTVGDASELSEDSQGLETDAQTSSRVKRAKRSRKMPVGVSTDSMAVGSASEGSASETNTRTKLSTDFGGPSGSEGANETNTRRKANTDFGETNSNDSVPNDPDDDRSYGSLKTMSPSNMESFDEEAMDTECAAPYYANEEVNYESTESQYTSTLSDYLTQILASCRR